MSTTLTRAFAGMLGELMTEPVPTAVGDHARRSLLNVVGTAVGASRSAGVGLLVAQAIDQGSTGATPVLGRHERLDPLWAATVNGFAAHVDDFDDTHLAAAVHPGAATLAAVLSAPDEVRGDGRRVLKAFALGCEAQLRVAMAMTPEHYEDGWHITGTCAPIGAAVAVGLLLGLDAERLGHAIGVAASQTLGQREGFGTMTKAFHVGKGAANGLHAALLAARGFTAAADALEHPRGYFAVLAPRGHRPTTLVEDPGTRWELLANTFKPYPCATVTHPVIDAAIELHGQLADVSGVRQIVARVHPLVTEVAGELDPTDGLQAKFSTAHGLAAGLVYGTVSLAQYGDRRVRAEDVAGVRSKVRFVVDRTLGRAEAHVSVVCEDGSVLESHVPHARGSLERRMTDAELTAKVQSLVEPVVEGCTSELIDAVGRLTEGASLDELLSIVCPTKVPA